jgi:hypothetical protein
MSGITAEMSDEAHALIKLLGLLCPVLVPSVKSSISNSEATVYNYRKIIKLN